MAYKFPWTNYHELNLDWILDTVKKLFAQTEQNNAIVTQYDGRLTEVELTADNAQTAAEQAQQNSTAALDLAQGAQTTATQAQQAAAQAQQAAGQAQTAAGQALEAAATAQQTATQAQQTAQNFDGRITQAENNAASALQAAQAFDEQVQGAITAANNANEAATAALTTATETSRELAAQRDTLEDIIENAAQSLEVDLSTKADVIINTASGNIASFNDGADDMPIKKLVVNIEPVQAGSGDPSPDNVRPISGWTGAEIEQRGKNLLDKTGAVRGGFDANGNVIENAGDSRYATAFLSVKPNTTYYIDQTVPLTQGRAGFWYDENKAMISQISFNGAGVSSGAVSSPTNAKYCRLGYLAKNEDVCSMSVGSSAPTAYEAFKGRTIPISWETEAGTVYGGTLDVISGLLTVDRAKLSAADLISAFESFDANRNRYSSYIRERYNAIIGTSSEVNSASAISNSFNCNLSWNQMNSSTAYPGYIGMFHYSSWDYTRCYIFLPSSITTRAESEEYLTANNVELCYLLATPLTYQLTPQQVKTLYQYNNIWSDVGSVNVEYPADTKTYIDNKFAELQALILEH